jgi:hypothetical protein
LQDLQLIEKVFVYRWSFHRNWHYRIWEINSLSRRRWPNVTHIDDLLRSSRIMQRDKGKYNN